jgi:uncharacterized protein
MQPIHINKIIQKTKKYSKQMSPKDLHHGFEHSQRVRNYALQIAKTEKADLTIVEIASYLHDIGRGHEKNQYHTKTSSKLAKTFLTNIGFPKKQTQKIIHCIETHSRKQTHKKIPKTTEAKILYDADGLEMIGAVGLLRTALSAQVQSKDWKYVLKKAKWRLKIKDDFLTATGKKIAKQRQKLITTFIHQLANELQKTTQNPIEENPQCPKTRNK